MTTLVHVPRRPEGFGAKVRLRKIMAAAWAETDPDSLNYSEVCRAEKGETYLVFKRDLHPNWVPTLRNAGATVTIV